MLIYIYIWVCTHVCVWDIHNCVCVCMYVCIYFFFPHKNKMSWKNNDFSVVMLQFFFFFSVANHILMGFIDVTSTWKADRSGICFLGEHTRVIRGTQCVTFIIVGNVIGDLKFKSWKSLFTFHFIRKAWIHFFQTPPPHTHTTTTTTKGKIEQTLIKQLV